MTLKRVMQINNLAQRFGKILSAKSSSDLIKLEVDELCQNKRMILESKISAAERPDDATATKLNKKSKEPVVTQEACSKQRAFKPSPKTPKFKRGSSIDPGHSQSVLTDF